MRKLLSLLVFTLLLAAAPAFAQGSTGLERISFAAGATSASVSGQVTGTVGKGYALYAFAGQQMDININNATLTVVSPSGSPLVRGTVTADPVRSFSTVLPETGDYLIYITAPAGSGALNYTMNVSIVSGGGGSAPTAERIRFVPGGTGAVVTGYVAGGNQNSYLLYAFAGQTMTLTLDNGTLTVVSPSGSPLVRGTVTAEPIRSFNMVLPETGDYTIQVSVPASSPAIGYTLAASVTGSISGGSSTPERITFAAGGTSATITGQVSGTVRKSYVLGAFAGQSMTVNVTNAFMTVVSPVGDPMARAQNNAQSLTQTLNDSGDYSIEISVPPATGTVNYTLYVSIVGTPSASDQPNGSASRRVRPAPSLRRGIRHDPEQLRALRLRWPDHDAGAQ
ncbi:MAG: hypothetical protein U0528_06830 [Anaerolineae bacterium]